MLHEFEEPQNTSQSRPTESESTSGLDEDFARQLQAGMADLLTQMNDSVSRQTINSEALTDALDARKNFKSSSNILSKNSAMQLRLVLHNPHR